jgi:hypothetical protein
MALMVATSLALVPGVWVGSVEAAPSGEKGAVEIEILSLSSNDAVEEAAALTDAFKHALIGAPGVVDHGKSHALEAIALQVGCDDAMAAACAPKIAAEIKWDKFIYGTVKKTPPNKITATLHYYNAGQMKTVAKTYDAGPLAKDGTSPELKKIATEALYAMLGGAPKGKVDVTVIGPAANEDGELLENGASIGAVSKGKASVDLPSGPHTVELRVKGFASTTGTVEVTPAGTTLELSPVRLAPAKPIPWQLYGGIGAMAVGAVFIGVGVATSISVKNLNDDPTYTAYRRRWPGSDSDVCAHAKNGQESPSGTSTDKIAAQAASICDDASSKQTMQFVWYGLGGVFLAGGAILVLTDKSGSSNADTTKDHASNFRLEVKPTVTTTGSSLSLVGQF